MLLHSVSPFLVRFQNFFKFHYILSFHKITDYRGYGDSLPASPTESGLVQDAIAVYKYITSVTSNPIFAWGHSLGNYSKII